jgi:hypothetical protein
LSLNKKAISRIISSLEEIMELNNITGKFLKRSLKISDPVIDFLKQNSKDVNLLREVLDEKKIEKIQCKLPACNCFFLFFFSKYLTQIFLCNF